MKDDLIFNLYLIARRFGKMLKQAFVKAGYHYLPEHFTLLIMIHQNQKIKHTEISVNTYKSKATITRIIDKLVEDGLIEKRPDPKDRRSCFLHLTDKGKKLYAILIGIYLQEEKRILQGVSQEAYDQCIRNVFFTIRRNMNC